MPDSRQSRRRRNRIMQAADRVLVLDEANPRAALDSASSDYDDDDIHPATYREREIYQMGFRDGEEAAWSKAHKQMENREEELTDMWVGGIVIFLIIFTAFAVLVIRREALWEALQSY